MTRIPQGEEKGETPGEVRVRVVCILGVWDARRKAWRHRPCWLDKSVQNVLSTAEVSSFPL